MLAHLKPEFPDLTISKIRFLEGEGLVQPERTPSGYRKFSSADVSRLRYVLAQQKDHYLPLKVIKEQLEAIDRGLVPPGSPGTASPRRACRTCRSRRSRTTRRPPTTSVPRRPRCASRARSCSTRPACAVDQLSELEQFGLISKRPGGHYDDDALAVGKIVAELGRFGLEGRHLRAFRTAAEREVGLFGQVVGPMSRQRGNEAKARAEETVRELAALSVRLHAALVQIGLREVIGGA